jgi:hypothetical protein
VFQTALDEQRHIVAYLNDLQTQVDDLTLDKGSSLLEVLTTYQEQYHAEFSFRDLQGPMAVSPVFLHTPERIKCQKQLITFCIAAGWLNQISRDITINKEFVKWHQNHQPHWFVICGKADAYCSLVPGFPLGENFLHGVSSFNIS